MSQTSKCFLAQYNHTRSETSTEIFKVFRHYLKRSRSASLYSLTIDLRNSTLRTSDFLCVNIHVAFELKSPTLNMSRMVLRDPSHTLLKTRTNQRTKTKNPDDPTFLSRTRLCYPRAARVPQTADIGVLDDTGSQS